MKLYQVGAPLERIATDILGPLPLTNDGNLYIIVTADYFTKWTEAFAIPCQEAEVVADVVVREFITSFGACLEIHSDQGRNYESKLFKEVCRLLGVRKTRTTPGRPQSDGMVERYNRTLERMLRAFVSSHQRDWDKYLPYLTMAYRSSQHESTKYTPNRLMLGREVNLPIDIVFGRPEEEALDETEYVQRLRERMEEAHRHARKHLQKSSIRQKKNYDRLSSGSTFKRGDAVWIMKSNRKKGISPKLSPRWEGPYLVVEPLCDVLYKIQKS